MPKQLHRLAAIAQSDESHSRETIDKKTSKIKNNVQQTRQEVKPSIWKQLIENIIRCSPLAYIVIYNRHAQINIELMCPKPNGRGK